MRIYIIGNDGITLCRETPATVNDGEIAVASKEELHAAPLNGKRLLALWNALPSVEKRRTVGDRKALIDRLWPAPMASRPGGIYQSTRLADPSAQRRLIARAGEIGKSWTELPGTRQRVFLTTLIERIDVGADQIDIHLRPARLAALLDVAATPLSSVTDDEIQILSMSVRLRRAGRAIRMLIEGTDPFATAKPDARLVKLLIRARRFHATLLGSDGVPFAALAKREGVSPSYFTRLVRLSYLAPDITETILDGRQPRDLTADKLLAHSRLPLGWHEQRTVLGMA